MKQLNVVVACEESQEVCKAFRELGHNAYSCDIQECSGGHPEWHIRYSVDPIMLPGNPYIYFYTQDGDFHKVRCWDLIIAHPPCTYMSAAGACRMYPRKGELDMDRFGKALEAKEFFMMFYNHYCRYIAIENPKPLKCVGLPPESQRIQPYQFGEPWSKLTYLWLKGLPELKPTEMVNEHKPYVSCGTSHNKGNPDKAGASRAGGASKTRSKTFPGIAKAMAQQWGEFVLNEKYHEQFQNSQALDGRRVPPHPWV